MDPVFPEPTRLRAAWCGHCPIAVRVSTITDGSNGPCDARDAAPMLVLRCPGSPPADSVLLP